MTRTATQNRTFDFGNNESASEGIFPQRDGTYLAMTLTQSKYFKTLKGAQRWFARRTA